MRGKRFLETKVVNQLTKSKTPSTENDNLKGNGSSGGNNSSSSRSSFASYLTLGYLGGSGSNSPGRRGASSQTKETTKATADRHRKHGSHIGKDTSYSPSMAVPDSPLSIKKKLLFVQDPSLLLIISCDKSDPKGSFRVYIAAPLLYTGLYHCIMIFIAVV